MTGADVLVVGLWVGVTLYALFAGADFGGGFWDLIAGGAERGERPRALIDRAVTPVWEANHVWLIFLLVVSWSGFPQAFAAIMRTLYLPLALAALGIVLRGSGFALRHLVTRLPARRALGATFAASSLVTPFFMGTVVGAVAAGRVRPDQAGDPVGSWTGPASLVIGVLFVATCAYIAAVFLVAEARRSGELVGYFRARAIGAGVVAGALALVSLAALRADAPGLVGGLVGEGLPLVILSGVCGAATLVLLAFRPGSRGTRVLAAGAVVGVVWAWGLVQYPELLPGALTVDEAVAPAGTLTALLVVFVAAALLVVPALTLLYSLDQRSLLEEE